MKAVVHEVDVKHKQDQLRMKWREQIKESMRRIGLKREDVQIDAGGKKV